MFLRPFGLHCSACFGILFVSILCQTALMPKFVTGQDLEQSSVLQVIASEEVSGHNFACISGIPTRVTRPIHPKLSDYTMLAVLSDVCVTNLPVPTPYFIKFRSICFQTSTFSSLAVSLRTTRFNIENSTWCSLFFECFV